MQRIKLQSQHRLPQVYQHSGARLAFYNQGEIFFEGEKFALGEFMGNGAFGMIFARDNYIVKLEISDEIKLLEMDINHWASEEGYGPRFWAWGRLENKRPDLDALVAKMVANSKSLPHWYDDMQSSYGPVIVYYSVFEKWDMDLRQWIRQQPDPRNALCTIPEPVMKRLADGVLALHKLEMIHLDLLPKNILVNLYDGQVVDIAMTDFGNVIHRNEWFFDQTMKMRDEFVRYFLEHKELEDVGRGLVDNNPSPDADAFQMTYYWLLNEPDNFDWALLTRYNLGPSPIKLQQVPWISMPPRFNFNLPWSKSGKLSIQVKFADAMHPLGEIYGLWTLRQLRKFVEQRYPQVKGLHLTWEADGIVQKVAFRQQKEFRVSTVIRKEKGYFVEFL